MSEEPMLVTFHDSDGREVPSLSERQMREVDRVAIEETGPNLFQMMENAGRNLAGTAMEVATGDGPVVVLAGTGGNGGGGITAARHLANHGLEVLLVITDPSRLGEVPAFQLHVLAGTGTTPVSSEAVVDVRPAVVVDAIIGYSLKGPPTGAAAELIELAATFAAPVLSLDIPSGIDATSGQAPGNHVAADTTMTLALPKHGLGNPAAGEIVLADIGIPIETYRRAAVPLRRSPFGGRCRVPLTRGPGVGPMSAVSG
jgi:NAD(P)H-hydrate epimerase